jgi:hypothetical protein
MPIGTLETLDVLDFLFSTIAVYKDVTAANSPGGKKIDPFREGYRFLSLVPNAIKALSGIDKVPGELKDIDPVKQERIINMTTRSFEEIGIGNDRAQAMVMCGLKAINGQALSLLIQLADKNPDTWQAAMAKMQELGWL